MGHSAKITALLAIPGFGTTLAESSAAFQPTEAVSLGIVLDSGLVCWATCGLARGETAVQTIETIETVVAPLLVGATLADYRALAAAVDGLQESYVVERELPLPDSLRKANPIMSRRGFLRGLEASPVPVPEPVIERELKKRPLAKSIRLAVSLALLEAFCHVRQQPAAVVLAEAYGLAEKKTAVGIHLSLGSGQLAVTSEALKQHVASVGYETASDNPAAQLGKQGKELQKYARDLKAWFEALGNRETPALYFNTHGGIGSLFQNKSGLSFGLLYGIGMAVSPFVVRFEDPVLLDERDAHIKEIAKLKSYLQRRRTQVEIVAGAWLDSLAAVHAFLAADAVHMLHLNLQRLGSIGTLMEAALACHVQEVPIMVSDGVALPQPGLVAQLASGARAELVASTGLVATSPAASLTTGDMGFSLFFNELQRLAATSNL